MTSNGVYAYCRKCKSLIHPSEVYKDRRGRYSHTVITTIDATGHNRSIIHTDLVEED